MNRKILLIGDSITEAFKTDKLLPELNIINKGVYGDNTTGVLARLEKDVIDQNPDVVFVLIGTNDFALERTDDELTGNIDKIINILTEKLENAAIYLTPILPTRNIENRPNERIREVNNTLKMLTQKYGIRYFDLYSCLLDNGQIAEHFTIDGLHLSDDAYKIWADFLTSTLQNS